MRQIPLLALLTALLAACGQSSAASVPTQAPAPTAPPLTATPVPTEAPTEVATEIPTATARPSATPVPPTATAQPTAPPAPPTPTPAPPSATPLPPTPERAALRYAFPVQNDACWYPATHHTYPAVDIFCPIGTPFVAVTSGVVDFVSREDVWDRATNRPEDRSGLAVAIIGDDGIRYYGSHLSEVAEGIEPGARVEAGQLLGLTGDTGNAKGTDPHVHFGISRPTTPDDWEVRRGQVWPQPYLAAWKRGENVTPKLP